MKPVVKLALGLAASATLTLLAGPIQAQGAQAIDVHLTNFKFTPDTLHLHSGTTYRLRLINDAAGGHSFSSPDLFANSRIQSGKIDDGKIEVHKGETVEVVFTPTKPGHYAIKCTHPFHAGFGMKGEADVD